MLNRRHAILAASGAVAAGTSHLLHMPPVEAAARTASSKSDQPTDAMTHAAEACAVCVAECDQRLARSGMTAQLQSLMTECRDICTVTATLLSRSAEISPAICQSCQDACERLAMVESSVQQAASDCAKACRFVLDPGAEASTETFILAN